MADAWQNFMGKTAICMKNAEKIKNFFKNICRFKKYVYLCNPKQQERVVKD